MSCCQTQAIQKSGKEEVVEVKSAIHATGAWLDLCNDVHVRHQRERKQNLLKLKELENGRKKLNEDRDRAQAEMKLIQQRIDKIDSVLKDLQAAEEAVNASEAQIRKEEDYIRQRNGTLRERLESITDLVNVSHANSPFKAATPATAS